MKMRKLLALLLSLSLLALTACGGSGGASAPAAEAGTSAAEDAGSTPAASGDTVNITFMGWEVSPLESAAVEAGIKLFEEQNPNIKVEYTSSANGPDYTAKLLSATAGGQMPDVMFMQTIDYRMFVNSDTLTDITDRFSEEFPLDDFIESSRTIMDVDGRVYGISSCTVSPILYYNKDVFDAAGIEYPSANPDEAMTVAEFRALAKELTNEDKGIFGAYGMEVVQDTLAPFLLSNRENKFKDDYTKSAMNTPGVAEIYQNWYDMRHVDGSAPDAMTLESSGMSSSQMLQTGKIAMLINGSWALQELSNMDFPIGMAPLPKFQDAVTTGQAHLHCIAKDSPHQEEAWEFLKFLSSMDYQGELVKAGLWMPNRTSMYEDVDAWYVEEVHGTEYREMLDYFQFAEVDPGALQLSSKCSDIIREESESFFQDSTDLDTALANIETRTNEELERVAAG